MNIGKKIHVALLDNHLKQAELARKAGLHPSHLNKIIKGKVPKPDDTTIKKIADALNVPVENLVHISEPVVREPASDYITKGELGQQESALTAEDEVPIAIFELIKNGRLMRKHNILSREIEWLKATIRSPKNPTVNDIIEFLMYYRELPEHNNN